MNIAQNLERAARHSGHRQAIIFEDRRIMYTDLQAAVDRAAHGLSSLIVAVGDRVALFLPLFHCSGQNFIMNTAFNSGAALVLHRRFVPDDVLASIAGNGVTMFFAVPTVYIALLNAASSRKNWPACATTSRPPPPCRWTS